MQPRSFCRVAAAVLALVAGACVPNLGPPDRDTAIACGTPADCPAGWVCVGGQCLSAASGCVQESGGSLRPATDGNICQIASGASGYCKDGVCVAALCGDGAKTPDEECDDGNADDDDGCTSACTSAVCGDGIVRTGTEACDLGADNGALGSACTSFCRNDFCGDGHVGPGEACDLADDNGTRGGGCTETCQVNVCGDEHIGGGEECDLGSANGAARGACTATCTVDRCGDGHLGPTEECDDGATNGDDGDACTRFCVNDVCGDGHLGPAEACDTGSQVGSRGDPCTNACQLNTCPDGHVGPGEQCDDGNSDPTDFCVDCRLPGCGDGVVIDGVEECDNGSLVDVPGDPCTASCTNDRCGDGHLGPDELCDGGPSTGQPSNSCNIDCEPARCGDGYPHVGEECDDGNPSDVDACLNDCHAATCGDGHVRGSFEECDDGNTQNNDGCTSTCADEPNCHDLPAGVCPTGVIRWCKQTPISRDSQADAEVVCALCAGAACSTGRADECNEASAAFFTDATSGCRWDFLYQGDVCNSGDVWGPFSCGNNVGSWAP